MIIESLAGGQLVGKLDTEKTIHDEDLVDPAKSIESQCTERTTHGVPDQQGASENRGCRGDPQGHGTVNAPVVKEAAGHVTPGIHPAGTPTSGQGSTSFPSSSRY